MKSYEKKKKKTICNYLSKRLDPWYYNKTVGRLLISAEIKAWMMALMGTTCLRPKIPKLSVR